MYGNVLPLSTDFEYRKESGMRQIRTAITMVSVFVVCAQVYAGPAGIKHYRCVRAVDTIKIDGVLDEFSWTNARRVGDFERIISLYHGIEYHTEAAMVWDDESLYVAFVCSDPDMWCTMFERDDPLASEEVVEIFIDPDGDALNYAELEINPANVQWDLCILQRAPKWKADTEWNITGLRSAVMAYGTVNDSTDTDIGWTVEIAMPWKGFEEIWPDRARTPKPGEFWRLNLYRIERVAGLSGKEEMARLGELRREAAQKGDYREAARLSEEIEKIELRTEYTCWSPTYSTGFHDPSRFGVVEFVEKP